MNSPITEMIDNEGIDKYHNSWKMIIFPLIHYKFTANHVGQ